MGIFKNKKKIVCMILGIVAALSITACGQTAEPILGTWTATVGTESLSMTFLDNNDVILEEASNGDVYKTMTGSWGKADGEQYTMYDGYDKFDVDIVGTNMTLEGYAVVFEKE